MKKIIALTMCLILCLGLFGCSKKEALDNLSKGGVISGNVYENKDMGLRITIPSGESFYSTSEIEKEIFGAEDVDEDIKNKAREKTLVFAYSSGMMDGGEHYLCAMALADKKSKKSFFKTYDEVYSTQDGITGEYESFTEKIGNIEFEKRVYQVETSAFQIKTTVYYGFYNDIAINISYMGDSVKIESIK
ncbi:MAG: hypothetical protein IKZ25_04160 [Clostridia bacterium]|nr:hypothetical protein [Clostridia bacterium]